MNIHIFSAERKWGHYNIIHILDFQQPIDEGAGHSADRTGIYHLHKLVLRHLGLSVAKASTELSPIPSKQLVKLKQSTTIFTQ